MKFTINNVSYDTNTILLHLLMKTPARCIRKIRWLNRIVYDCYGFVLFIRRRELLKKHVNSRHDNCVLKAMPEYNANIPDDVFKYYERLASRGCCTAIAKASIYLDSYAKEPAVVDYAVRYAEKDFSYNNEAALNAAADRAICSLGFIRT